MSKSELRALFEKAELEETEKWLLRYAYIDERLVLNTCAKLNISESTYHRMLPIAKAVNKRFDGVGAMCIEKFIMKIFQAY